MASSVMRIDGSTDGSERQKLIERFNEPANRRVKCTLISTRARSLGINLHAANRVILVDGSWNPTHDLQAIFRAWRYGQKKPVYVYRLMAQGTMEEKIYKRQVIAFLYTAMRGVDLGLKSTLIVTPVNVLHNWKQEFLKWKPAELKPLRILLLEDVPRDHSAYFLAKWRDKGGILLIGYSAFWSLSLGRHVKDRNVANEICHALQYGPDILVCDEAHMIKNAKADITQALKQVNTHRRIALTGSPMQNNLMEYYCMVDFVREGFLGNSLEFRNRFQNPIENGQHTNSTSEDVKLMNEDHISYMNSLKDLFNEWA